MYSVFTSELRWFFEGRLPEAVDRWFADLGNHLITEPDRTDTYLILPEANNIGIKVRQGRVEIKKLIRNLGVQKISEKIAGQGEIWQKWSFDVDRSGNLPVSFNLEPSQWIGILKKRKLHRFAFKSGHLLSLPSTSPFPENGAHIELAEISVKNENWWTLGAEAFGQERFLEDHLALITERMCKDCKLDQLRMEYSIGYPGWLARRL